MSTPEQLAQATQVLELKDGRKLGVAEVGDPKGYPIFFFHGWPGSRASVLSMDAIAKEQQVRLIGTDRPGMGLSSPKPKRALLDWPKDVEEVADLLGIEQFSVAGLSGGGPYALACTVKLPQRVQSVGIVAGMGPFELGTEGMRPTNKFVFGLAKKANWLLRFFLWLGIGRSAHDLNKLKVLIPKSTKDLPPPDQKVMREPEIAPLFALEMQEAFRQGAKWVAQEGAIYTSYWGFNFEDLPNIPTYLWHGDQDLNVPIHMGRTMAQRASHTQATFDPEHGHISIFAQYRTELLDVLKPTS